jgi:tRNA(Ile)-lysidine synthetase-like protein
MGNPPALCNQRPPRSKTGAAAAFFSIIMAMLAPALQAAASSVPPGRWAVGVSGGADSVALLHLLRHLRPDLSLHVVHLDHQTRGPQSDADAGFTADLAAAWNLPLTLARRLELEPKVPDLPANPSARYRALRLALYGRVCDAHGLDGVILAHHADDQAETVMLRLLRGADLNALTGMRPSVRLGDLLVLRPLLGVGASLLRGYLRDAAQSWREDASNASPKYLRNRVRQALTRRPDLTAALLRLAEVSWRWRRWVSRQAPVLGASFAGEVLCALDAEVAAESCRRWLRERGAAQALAATELERFVSFATDAAAPARLSVSGGLVVRRRRGMIFVETAPA